MSWWKKGFQAQEHAFDYDAKQSGPRRFWMPSQVEKVILMLDDDPASYWEHSFKFKGSWQNTEPCKIRNRMDDDCAVCDRYPDRKPSFVGMFSCISMTPWTTKPHKETGKTRTFNYGRELVVAKMGSKKNPGMLKDLERFKERYEGLTGGIFKVYRKGEKTEVIGNEWTLVEKIPKDQIIEHGKKVLREWAQKVNEEIEDPENYVSLESLWERSPWVPFNYEEIIKIRSNEELKLMFSTSTSDDDGDDGGSKAADEASPY